MGTGQLQEQEFFASRSEEIANAVNAAAARSGLRSSSRPIHSCGRMVCREP